MDPASVDQDNEMSLQSCRPRDHLAAAGKLFPAAWAQSDAFRADRGTDVPDWPQWCYLPIAGWGPLVFSAITHGSIDQ